MAVDPGQWSPSPPTGRSTGDAASAALHAGASVAGVTAVLPAATMVEGLLRGTVVAVRARHPVAADAG